jgi:hypothetical protein
MRPRGDLSRALATAAAHPGTVVQLAHRSQVSVPAARYTVSRMVDRGELVVVQAGRPVVLGAAQGAADSVKAPAADDAYALLTRSFWETQRVP